MSGGVALTVLTGGLGAIVAGGALIGGGSSLMINPISKKLSGERQTASDLVSDVTVGSIIGVASGGLSIVGSSMVKGAGTAAKVAAQVGAATATGATGGVVGETARAIKGEDVSADSYVKAIGVGAVCGMAGGFGGQAASSVSQGMSSQVVRAGTRVVVQAATAGTTDAALQVLIVYFAKVLKTEFSVHFTIAFNFQVYESGEVDIKRALMSAASAATVATTAECAKAASMNTNRYIAKVKFYLYVKDIRNLQILIKFLKNLEVNETLIEETKANVNISPDQEEVLKKQLNDLNSNSDKKEFIKKQIDTKQLEKVAKARASLGGLDAEKKRINSILKKSYNKNMRPIQQQEAINFDTERENLKKQLNAIQKSRETPAKIVSASFDKSSRNLHPLTGEHSRQMAFDLPDQEQGRGRARAIVDVIDGKAYLSDITADHNYDKVNKLGERLHPSEPATGKLTNQEMFGRNNQSKYFEDEDDDEKKDK